MANRTVYVTGSASGTPGTDGATYATLAAAIAGEDGANGDLVTSACILTIDITAALDDTTAVSVTGFTTSADYYIDIKTSGDARHAGVWSDSKYRRGTLEIAEDYVRVDGLQCSGGASYTVRCTNGGIGASNAIRISNCLIKASGNASNAETPLLIADADTNVTIWNCCVYGASTNASAIALYVQTCTTANIYGCTIQGGKYGLYRGAGTVTVKNCYVSAESGKCYTGTITQTTCAASDTTASDAALDSIAYNTTNFTNVTAGSEDFALPSGSALIGVGTTLTDDPPGSTALGVDIKGTSRTVTWDIGAFEYVAATGGQPLAKRHGGIIHTVGASPLGSRRW